MRQVIAPRTVSRAYKRPAVPVERPVRAVQPRAIPTDALGCPVIPTPVKVALKTLDRDVRAVEEGATTGTMLARKAAEALAEWKPSGPRKEPRWLTAARKRAPVVPVGALTPPKPQGPAFLPGVLMGASVTK